MFTGSYHGTQRHPSDLKDVVSRARQVGCEKLIVTGSDLEHSKRALELCEEFRTSLLSSFTHPHTHTYEIRIISP